MVSPELLMYITKRDLCHQGPASVADSDGADSDDEYGYDANGNVVRDDNRGISSIKHNPLNLPQEVRFADGHYILQAYSADGRLLRRITGEEPVHVLPPRPWLGLGLSSAPAADPAAITWPGIGDKPILPDTSMYVKMIVPDTVTYAGAFVLKGRELDRVLASSGYIKGDTAYYFLRDHQGSVRQVVSGADGCVVQENQYYPYGALHGESSALALSASNGASASPYKYGGKEHISFANAHLLDFTARTYDPAILSFHQPDPCQEKYYPLSPWLYCAADPVNHVDPTGKDYVVRKNNEERTYTVEAVYCVDKDWEKYAMEAVEVWNGMKGEAPDEYTIQFNLTVVVVDPKDLKSGRSDRLSKFQTHVNLMRSNPNDMKYNSFEFKDDKTFKEYYKDNNGKEDPDKVAGTTVGYAFISINNEKCNIGKEDWNVYTLAHEIGHTLRLYHSKSGLMNPVQPVHESNPEVSNYELNLLIINGFIITE